MFPSTDGTRVSRAQGVTVLSTPCRTSLATPEGVPLAPRATPKPVRLMPVLPTREPMSPTGNLP